MRNISARLKELEGNKPTASSNPSTSAPSSLQRILNPPQSPSYVGPTSAEFGLDHRDDSLLDETNEEDSDGVDEEQNDQNTRHASSAMQSPAASTSPEKFSLQAMGLKEALRLIQVYNDTVGIMYPCVDLASLRTYVVEYYESQGSVFKSSSTRSLSTSDQDWFHARDIQVLKILLATALLVESHGQSEQAAILADSVEDRFASRLKVAQVDMKECLILTLLASHTPYLKTMNLVTNH